MNTSNEGNNNDDINRSNNNNGKNEQRTKGKGRQKIPIEKIENETNLQVTFSKRRAGIFKKASELSTLCGAESAVVIFSPGNKPHSFGHPNVETIANRFHNTNNSNRNPQGNAADRLMMAHGEITMYRRNQELIALEAQLELEKQHKKELDKMAKALPSLDGLSYEQLEQLKKSVVSFKREFEAKVKSNAGEASSWVNPNPNPNPSTQQHQGLGFPARAVYGYGTTNIVPTIPGNSSSISLGYPLDNFGYTMQYPPIGPSGSGFNYGNIGVDPSIVVPYNGTGRAARSRSGTGNRSRSRNRNDMGTNEGPDATPQNHDI